MCFTYINVRRRIFSAGAPTVADASVGLSKNLHHIDLKVEIFDCLVWRDL